MKKIIKIISTFSKDKPILFWGFSVIISIWIIAAIVFRFAEGFPIFDSIYRSIFLEGLDPKTMIGKIFAIILDLSKIGILGIIFATVAEEVVNNVLNRKRGHKKMEEHVVICGWDNKTKIAAKELLDAGKKIIVISNSDNADLKHENFEFIKGDPTDEINLKNANIEKAANVLISGANDTETLLCALAIESFRKDIEITCIVDDPRVIKTLMRNGVDQVISSDEFFGLFFSRSIFVKGLTSFLRELMSNEGTDFYEMTVDKDFVGLTVLDAMLKLKRECDATLVGVVKGEKIEINPKSDVVLSEGDKILYFAQEDLCKR